MRRISMVLGAVGLLMVGCPDSDDGGDTGATTTGGDTTTTGEDTTGEDTTGEDTTGETTTGEDTTGETTTGEDLPTCAGYCTKLQESCGDEGENAQFESAEACESYCGDYAKLPIGETSDTAENTVGCRTYHADVAGESAENAAIHCTHAGPTGDNTCGTMCENYCHLALANCTDGEALFDDVSACMTACSEYDATGNINDTAGNTLQCRIYHLGVAGNNDAGGAATHCAHGAADGGGVCVDALPTCDDYCSAVQAACGDDGATSQYASVAACKTHCETNGKLPAGTIDDTAGNTIGCRTYHAGVAGESAENAAIHCPHAGADGGSVCGSYCDVYCDLAAANCSDLYADGAACQTACEGFAADGAGGDATGDSVQCRIYHLGVAGGGDDAAAIHCPHAAADGGGICVDSLPEPSCQAYCEIVTASCTGDNAQYADNNACMAYCDTAGKLPLGAKEDTGGNTIGCRIYHADVASGSAENAATHCPHAGPSGGNVCGNWCSNYCSLATQNCTGANQLYDTEDQCITACNSFAADADAGAVDGDSVQCRIYHLGVAGSGGEEAAATHCPHGSESGAGICAPQPTCEDLCDLLETNCTGEFAQYANKGSCLATCSNDLGWDSGLIIDTSGNTVGCRMYHATVAGTDGDTSAAAHCGHAGPTGGGVCGSYCDVYCDASNRNCKADNALYASDDQCQSACGGLLTMGSALATDGDSLQCRLYHLGVAGSDPASTAANHCPHGGLQGGGVCVDETPTCTAYCAAVQASCGDAGEPFSQHASLEACQGYCNANMTAGSSEDTGGDTIGCRLYHARVAATTSPDVHCAHAGPSGGDVCGTWCSVYCGLASANCTEGNAIYANSDACALACGGLDNSGAPGDTGGDSLQCRIYHLGVAGQTLPDTHCPHGGQDGGGVCVGAVAKVGDTCEKPFVVPGFPYATSNDNSLFTDAYSTKNNCDTTSDKGAGTADVVYRIDTQTTGEYTFTVSYPEVTAGATMIYITEGCDDLAGLCVGNSGDLFHLPRRPPSSSSDAGEWKVELSGGKTYFVILDGFFEGDAAPYDLEIDAPCVPQCDGKSCGDDACGSTCGAGCSGEEVCTDAGQCVEEAGSCSAPTAINLGDTSGTTAGDDFTLTASADCTAGAVGTNDAVYAFGFAGPGTYTFSTTAGTVHVLGSCEDAGSCLAAGASAEFTAEAAGSVTVVVEDADAGFTLTVAKEMEMGGVTYSDVQSIFASGCAGSFCHDGSKAGGHNIALNADDAQKSVGNSGACGPSMTKAECMLFRVKNGTMPLGGAKLPQDQIDQIEAWVNAGAKP